MQAVQSDNERTEEMVKGDSTCMNDCMKVCCMHGNTRPNHKSPLFSKNCKGPVAANT